MSADRMVHLVTGFGGTMLANRLVRAILDMQGTNVVRCVVGKSHAERARAMRDSLAPAARERLTLLEGEAWALDFGLSGEDWKRLAGEVQVIHHAAQVTQGGLDRNEALRVNRGSTVEVLELAHAAARLDRLVLWSSTSVAGARQGFVLEDELDVEAAPRNPVEESLRRSELLVRAERDDLPTTILRPGIVVGDSRTGEIERMEGPYLLVLLMLDAPPNQPMPLPVRPDVALPIVPIDYVVRAGLHIARDPRSRGRCFHLVDPDPLTARRVFELLAASAGRDLPRPFLPSFLANRLMRLPGIQPGGARPLPSAFLDQIADEVVFDDHGARSLLTGSGIQCPAFESYVDALVRYVREQQRGAPSVRSEARTDATP